MPIANRREFLQYIQNMAVGAATVTLTSSGTQRCIAQVAEDHTWRKAISSADIASYSISKVQRWLREKALPTIDQTTGLYPADGKWNYRDTAADCYPFLCWAAWLTDLDSLYGPVLDILRAESRLCNHYGTIPVPYDWKQQKQIANLPYPEIVFQASEYIKDGLIAIVEATGRGPWFDRMLEIAVDLWQRADIDSPYGKIISKNVEVNGEQLQALVRLFSMTGDERFLEWAERLGDLYLFDPKYYPRRLRDHGCEVIGGLGLLLAIESEANPKKFRQYVPQIERIFDAVLARGTNEDGIMVNSLGDQAGPQTGALSDGWGYNYVGFLCHDMATGSDRYRQQVVTTLQNLAKPLYRNYPWEGKSIDGFADSIEGAIYLINRIPVAEAMTWVDLEVADNVAYADQPLETADLWGTMKLQANGVRTVVMHALMHTQGTILRPWNATLKLGAAKTVEGGLAVYLHSDEDWKGRLVFDRPRHHEWMRFSQDWPRMNTLPEWFTVADDQELTIVDTGKNTTQVVSGRVAREGWPLEVRGQEERRLLIIPTTT
jgi:hypothetical protein